MRASAITEWERGAAFLFAPVFVAIGALVYFGLRSEPGWLELALALAVATGVWAAARNRVLLGLTFGALALLVAGAVLGKFETWRAGTRVLGAEISTRLTGRVAGVEHMANGRVRLTLDVLATERPVLRYAPDRVRVSARAVPARLAIGNVVTGIVRLMPPSGPVRPGSYDFSFESYFDGVGASGFFMKGPDFAAPASSAASLAARIAQLRETVAQRIRDTIGGPEGEVAAALVVGVRAGIPDQINEALRRTGLYHIISISGLHMALVAGTVMLGLRYAFALFPNLSARRPVKKFAAAAALVALTAYLAISGAEVAAQRSFIMLAVMLVAVCFDRAALTLRNLAISALVVLALAPHEAVGPSFQMSFAATAALVGAYQLWSERGARSSQRRAPLRSLAGRARRRLAGMALGLVATSVIAGLATAVFGAWHFQRVSPLSLAANLVVMPVVSVIVMPAAVLAALVMPVGLDGPALAAAGWGISLMLAAAAWFSERSPVDAVGLIPAASVVLITVALVLATLLTTRLRLAAIPFVGAGIALLGSAERPDVLISEDARLVAVRLDDGRLAVNRARPNAFTVADWQRALAASEVVRPAALPSLPPSETGGGERAQAGAEADTSRTPGSGQTGEPFRCIGQVCAARTPSGAVVVHAPDAAAAESACASASLIVIEDAAAKNPCRRRAVRVVTGREIARSGSAAVTGLRPDARSWVDHAVSRPYRPWHAHRAFSREARGLPPYVRTPKQDVEHKQGDAEAEPPARTPTATEGTPRAGSTPAAGADPRPAKERSVVDSGEAHPR